MLTITIGDIFNQNRWEEAISTKNRGYQPGNFVPQDSMEETYAPAVHIKEIEIQKTRMLLKRKLKNFSEAGLDLPISDSPRGCPVEKTEWNPLWTTSRSLGILPNCLVPFRPHASKGHTHHEQKHRGIRTIPPLSNLFSKKDAKARLLRWVLLLPEFGFQSYCYKGAENLASRSPVQIGKPV
ncbi:hypothetical protein Tco_0636804 [Tanacetum coccineum]